MATLPLVGLRDDISPLVKTSLQHHNIPVTAVFDVLEAPYENRFIAVATPLVETKGLRDAYMKIFSSLETETFATKSFLRLHTLVLSLEELKEIRRVLKKGMTEANLPRLAHLRDVVVRMVDDAKNIHKSGVLHIVSNKNGSLLLTFGSFGPAGGAMKPLTLQKYEDLDRVFSALKIRGTTANGAISELQKFKHASVPISCTLDVLYTQGLI